jgi:glycerol-3-phosphate acyltransferase PlsY
MVDLQILFWTAAGFLFGAIPFSILLSRGLGGEDPRVQADRNPGAFNAWRSAGWRAGIPAILLDFFKGAIPVGFAFYGVGITGIGLLPVALAPIVGHAFSPFLRFRGGKSLAVTFGVWAGLTFGEAALVLGLFFGLFYFALRPEVWAVVFGMLGLLLYIVLHGASASVFVIWTGNTAILMWKHSPQLKNPPRLRTELLARVHRILRR